MITQAALKKLLRYDKKSGKFYWRQDRGGISKGTEAGSGHNQGYIYIRVNKVAYLAHRLAWLYVKGVWPDFQIDHKNRIRSDNRWLNLMDLTHSQNAINRKPRKGSKSGVTGVGWNTRDGVWMAYVERNKQRTNLGAYTTVEAASEARKKYLERTTTV